MTYAKEADYVKGTAKGFYTLSNGEYFYFTISLFSAVEYEAEIELVPQEFLFYWPKIIFYDMVYIRVSSWNKLHYMNYQEQHSRIGYVGYRKRLHKANKVEILQEKNLTKEQWTDLQILWESSHLLYDKYINIYELKRKVLRDIF